MYEKFLNKEEPKKEQTLYEVFKDRFAQEATKHLKEKSNLKEEDPTFKSIVELVLWGARMMEDAYLWSSKKNLEQLRNVDWNDDDQVINHLAEVAGRYKLLCNRSLFEDMKDMLSKIHKPKDEEE